MHTLYNKSIMNKIMNTIILISLALLGSCVDKHSGEPLTIRNNSDQRIYYWFSYWKTANYTNYHYPDTILPVIKPVVLNSIAPHNATGDGEADPNWEQIFSEFPEGKFSIYFFKESPENQADWDLIRQTYNLVRKDVTHQELKKNNYSISYP